ncbi:MFS transporter [Hypericibacter terrae]|uniref:MFS transporter n=1 Tax=Hypericibacter terrae TaxID=2602015 RepID=A0A5J6MJB7_9PROT|nr:YbfB/YjiJ family MFS transporter [Hypericibacter terrae]QEX17544.1 MFS transporter [Hypericibacter terrae]
MPSPSLLQPGSEGTPSPGRAILSGLCASLVGIGLARFAYTPLVPVLIDQGWLSPAQAGYLGAGNFTGYLIGAMIASPAAERFGAVLPLRAMMLLAVAAFFACAAPLSFSWLFLWRLAAGISGGVLMVLAAPAVLPHLPEHRRGLGAGAIFTGVGLGIALSGTLLPLLLQAGLVATWCGLGVLSLILTGVAWFGWPRQQRQPDKRPPVDAPRPDRVAVVILIVYGLGAVGLVPHMIFLVDFVARGLGRGLHEGAFDWVLLGVGALVGPIGAGFLADRIGFRGAMRFALLVQGAIVAGTTVLANPIMVALSSFVMGAFIPGIVPLVLGRLRELHAGDPRRQQRAWARATVSFALMQAAAGYGFSWLYSVSLDYRLLFGGAAAALLLGFALDIGLARSPASR